MSVSNIMTSLNVSTRRPLDSKTYASSEAEILNITADKALVLFKGVRIFNNANNKEYYWLEESTADLTKFDKVGITYRYPANTEPIDGLIYANKDYAFYILKDIVIPEIPDIPEPVEKVTNKPPLGSDRSIAILDDTSYSLNRLVGVDDISIVKGSGNSIEIGLIKLTNPITKVIVDGLILKNYKNENSSTIRIKRFDLLSEVLIAEKYTLANNAVLTAMTDTVVTALPENFVKIETTTPEVLVTLGAINSRITPLTLQGGTFSLSNTEVDSELLIFDSVVISDSPVIQGPESKITIKNSKIIKNYSPLIVSQGTLVIDQCNIENIDALNTDGSLINTMGGASVNILQSNINTNNIVNITEDFTNVKIYGNTILASIDNPVVNSLPELQNVSINSIGNITNDSRMVDLNINYNSVNDISDTGVTQKVMSFRNREEAERIIGKYKLFINTNGSEEGVTTTHTLDITI